MIRLIIGLFGKLLAPLGFLWAGSERAERKRLEDAIERGREARNAASDERKDTDDASDADVVERLRKRDGDWRGV